METKLEVERCCFLIKEMLSVSQGTGNEISSLINSRREIRNQMQGWDMTDTKAKEKIGQCDEEESDQFCLC